jgi:hypothetical protein
MFHYVSLITCCSAKDDAVGARVVLCGPRGVIHIIWRVIDKVGLNQLLVPHQSPFSPLNQSSLLFILPCLVLPAPTPFRSILFIMVLGSLLLPRRRITVNVSFTREGLGLPLIRLLLMSMGGQSGPLRRLIPLTTYTWMTSYRPTKGGCHAGYPFGVI